MYEFAAKGIASPSYSTAGFVGTVGVALLTHAIAVSYARRDRIRGYAGTGYELAQREEIYGIISYIAAALWFVWSIELLAHREGRPPASTGQWLILLGGATTLGAVAWFLGTVGDRLTLTVVFGAAGFVGILLALGGLLGKYHSDVLSAGAVACLIGTGLAVLIGIGALVLASGSGF